MTYALDFGREYHKEVVEFRRQSQIRFLAHAAGIVLEAGADVVETMGHSVGRQKLTDFLIGTDSTFMRANALNLLPHYGVYANFRRVWIERLIENLRESGYLVVSGAHRPVLIVSEEAEELVHNPEELPLLPQEVLSDPVLGPSFPLSLLEKKLRSVRLRLARVLGRPPRQVISDPLVRGLCRDKPENEETVESRLSKLAKPYAGVIWKVLHEE